LRRDDFSHRVCGFRRNSRGVPLGFRSGGAWRELDPAAWTPVPGGYYGGSGAAISTQTPTSGTLRLSRMTVPKTSSRDRLGIEWTVAGAAGALLGLFTLSGSLTAGTAVLNLILDAGTIDATQASGCYEKVINQSLGRGDIWLGLVTQGAPATVPTYRSMSGMPEGVPLGAGNQVSGTGTTVSGVTGAFASAHAVASSAFGATAMHVLARAA